MSTLVISDLHLGMADGRDVLRRDGDALEALVERIRRCDRLVLLGDLVELLEGRPEEALEDAAPVLSAIGAAAGRAREVVFVPGNHDFAAVRPWLAARARLGRRIGLAAQVGRESTPAMAAITRGLRPARVHVRYPGIWLTERVYAMHGHYLDRHLTPDLVRRSVIGPFARVVGDVPENAQPEDYERAGGANFASLTGLLATETGGEVGQAIDRIAGHARRAALSMLPAATALLGKSGLAPDAAEKVGTGLRRAGLAAMSEVVARLSIEASHVVFGHTHRAGPFDQDDWSEWVTPSGVHMLNSGCWVHDPFLLEGAGPEHPWWPGRAVEVDADGEADVVSLLET